MPTPIDLLEEKLYNQFIAMFPQDRKARIEAVKKIVWIDKHATARNYSHHFDKESGEAYDLYEVTYEYTNQFKIHHVVTRQAIFGHDDSGWWVEIGDWWQLKERKEEIPLSTLLVSGAPISTYKPGLTGDYRIQGDVNIHYESLNGMRETDFYNVLNNSPFRNIISKEIFEFIYRKHNLVEWENYPEGQIHNEVIPSEMLGRFFGKLLAGVEVCNHLLELDYENHKIELLNTTYPYYLRSVEFAVPEGEGILSVKSPHHKTVTITLKPGFYRLYKSGGFGLDDLRIDTGGDNGEF
ncbi:MAG: hypothetical protein QXL94_06440 [Candidatus Parvarchaeum sp.]